MTVNFKEQATLHNHTTRITSITVPEDRLDTFYTSSRDKKVLMWKITYTQNFASVLKSFEGNSHYVNTLCVTKCDKIINGCADGTSKIYDTTPSSSPQDSSNKGYVSMKGHTRDVTCVCINANDTKILTTGIDSSIKVWNTKGELIKSYDQSTLNSHKDWITCASFIPNTFNEQNELVVTGCSDGTLKIWDIDNGTVLNTFVQGYQVSLGSSFSNVGLKDLGGVTCLDITPDGTYCAYASRDSEVYLINLARGELIRSFKTESVVYACAFAHTESVIALASRYTIYLWDIVSNKTLTKINVSEMEDENGNTKKEDSFCTAVAWAKNYLLVGFDNGKVKVFEYNREAL